MKTLLKYDFFFLKRTSKFIVFPAVAILFAILSPLTARYMNEIIEFLLGASSILPETPPVSVELSYIQYASDLFEIYLIVTIFVGVSIFMREKNKGELPLILSKPIPRHQYLLSKFISFMVLQLATLVLAGLVFSYYTYYLFDTVNLITTIQVLGLFFVYELFIVSLGMLFAMLLNSYAGASVLTFVTYIILSIVGVYEKGILDYLPGRVLERIVEVAYGISETSTVVMYILVSLLITTTFIILSIFKFRKYDI